MSLDSNSLFQLHLCIRNEEFPVAFRETYHFLDSYATLILISKDPVEAKENYIRG